jgi:hypothetical protein
MPRIAHKLTPVCLLLAVLLSLGSAARAQEAVEASGPAASTPERPAEVNGSTVEDRLRSLGRRVYRLTPADQQEALLLEYLSDGLPLMRQLGIDLVLQRLEQREVISPATRTALRGLLGNGTPGLRERAVAVLLSLNDDEAADLVAEQLAGKLEKDARVQNAMLKMLARKPRVPAAGALVDYLDSSLTRSAAAEALLAYADAGLLTDAQRAVMAERLGALFGRDVPPSGPLVRLYGLVVGDEGFDRFVPWMDHDNPVVRQAAVSAWLDHPGWPTAPLVARIEDGLLGPEIAKRLAAYPDAGRLSLELLSEEVSPQAGTTGTQLLLALAPRWSLAEAAAFDQRLKAAGVARAIHGRLLEAAVLGAAGADPLASLELRYRLASVFLADGEAARALGCLEGLLGEGVVLPAGQAVHDAAVLGLMAAARSHRVDRAVQFADLALRDAGVEDLIPRQVVAGVIEQLVQETLASNDTELAQRLYQNLRPLLGEARDEAELERFGRLEAAIAGADQPARPVEELEASSGSSESVTPADPGGEDACGLIGGVCGLFRLRFCFLIPCRRSFYGRRDSRQGVCSG